CVASWTTPASKRQPAGAAVVTSADGVRTLAQQRGFTIDTTSDARITSLYAAGWNVVALELESSVASASSGTLRVSEIDGSPAVLPLMLTGSASAAAHAPVSAIGPGIASIGVPRALSPGSLSWGPAGSSYGYWRKDLIEPDHGATWMRESAAHAP